MIPQVDSPVSIPIKDSEPSPSTPTCIGRFLEEYLILPKLLYFVLTLSVYSTHTFTAKYFSDEWDLDLWQYGLIAALNGFNFFGSIMWSWLADRTGHHKFILMMNSILYAASFTMLRFHFFDEEVQVVESTIYTIAFYGLSVFFVSALFPLLDTLVYDMLTDNPNFTKERFGRIRLWSTIGHTVITIINAFAMDHLKEIDPEREYDIMFINLCVASSLCSLLAFFTVPKGLAKKRKAEVKLERAAIELKRAQSREALQSGSISSVEAGRQSKSPRRQLLTNPHFLFFLLIVLTAGYLRSVMSYFLGFLMEEEMDMNKGLISIGHIFRASSEIAVFFFGKEMLNIFGVHWLLILGQLTGIIRILIYSLMPTEGNWFIMTFFIELLKGFNTAAILSASVRIAADIAPKGAEAIAQGLFSGIWSGLSATLAGALGGLLANVFNEDVQKMFLVTSLISIITLLLFAFKYAAVDRVICIPFISKHFKKSSTVSLETTELRNVNVVSS